MFDARDLGEANEFVGLQIVRDRAQKTLTVHQSGYARSVLAKYGFSDVNPRKIPLQPNLVVKSAESGDELCDQTAYRSLVGSLMYLAVCTRPDLSYAVTSLARHVCSPTHEHWAALKQVCRYVKGTTDLGITYGTDEAALVGYVDASYAAAPAVRRSTTGQIFVRAGGAVSWTSRLQATVAHSTCEAEFVATATAAKEALWLRKLVSDLGLGNASKITLLNDNQGSVRMIKNAVSCGRTKHIDVAHCFVSERWERGEIGLEHIPTSSMVADSLTKQVPRVKFEFCRDRMGLAAVNPA